MSAQLSTVVFVDDEPHVLAGLRRTLRSMREVWDMHFVISGAEALALLAARKVDVIVSDMRMPEMDGLQLLTTVMQAYPLTARIMLSGHADRDLRLRSMRLAHQYLAKPCEGSDLVGTISRVLALQSMLQRPELRTFIGELESVPSIPEIYCQLTTALETADASLSDVADIVTKDPGISARLLQVANSVYYGRSQPLAHPRQAVLLLGIETVRALTLQVKMFDQLATAKIFDASAFQRHSLRTAGLARAVARTLSEDPHDLDAAFSAGLLHDIGVLVLASNRPVKFAAVLHRSAAEGNHSTALEAATFGAQHAELGGFLLGLWGLPTSVVEAVSYHHQARLEWQSPVILALQIAEALQAQEEAPATWEPVSGPTIEDLEAMGHTDKVATCRDLIGNLQHD